MSAVAVEEKSVLDYNAGNPSGDPTTLGEHPPPKVPLVAVYPKEGTLYSDSPYVILDAPWVSAEKKAGAQDFLEYLLLPEQQKVFTDSVLPDGRPAARRADHVQPLPHRRRRDRSRSTRRVQRCWRTCGPSGRPGPQERPRVLVLMDVSGSMSTDSGSGGRSKLDLAKSAATTALGQLVDTDQVGFSVVHHRPADADDDHRRPRRVGAAGADPAADHRRDRRADPLNGTPLYAATRLPPSR